MSLRNATLFAIVGMALWTIRLGLHLFTMISGVSGGFVPANAMLVALIDFLAAVSLLVFFVVFYGSRP
jgi:hypothetical protein